MAAIAKEQMTEQQNARRPFETWDTVYYKDPDDGVSSGDYTVVAVNGDVLTLEADDGSAVEAHPNECAHLEWRDENVPNWAATYIENGDNSALDEEDIKLVDAFADRMLEAGYVMHNWTDDHNDFCRYPAFGLACDTTRVRYYKKMEDPPWK